jgi:hypothetical protein
MDVGNLCGQVEVAAIGAGGGRMTPLTDLEREWLILKGFTYANGQWKYCGSIYSDGDLESVLPSLNAEACERDLIWLANQYCHVAVGSEKPIGDEPLKWICTVYESIHPYKGYMGVSNNIKSAILEAGVKARRNAK